MFEDRTAENILNEMLESVDASTDKREGSLIYNALAPAAFELASCYADLNAAIDETFADTASLESLIRLASARGIEYIGEEKAVIAVEIEFNEGEK